MIQQESLRILSDKGECSPLLDLARLYLGGVDSPGESIEKMKSVLAVVDNYCLQQPFPKLELWKAELPKWFVDAFAPERSSEENEAYLRWWDSLNEDEKMNAARKPRRWSLGDWIYWFKPENRAWFWWHAKVSGPHEIILALQVDGYPFPRGSLEWLCRAAGANVFEGV